MPIQGVFSFLRQTPNAVSSKPASPTTPFRRSGIHRTLTGPPSDRFQRQTLSPHSPGTQPVFQKSNPLRKPFSTWIPKASAGAVEPVSSAPEPPHRVVNPIPYERADALLKTMAAETPYGVDPLLKAGYADGLKKLLLISNQLVSDMNGLRKQKRHNVRFVFYINVLEKSRDPRERNRDGQVRYYVQPRIITDQDRLYRPMHPGETLKAHPPTVDPENLSKGVSHIEFSDRELQTLKSTAKSLGFQTDEAHFSEYLTQLFAQTEQLMDTWSMLPKDEKTEDYYHLGIYSDQLPYMQTIYRRARNELPVRDPKGWYRMDNPKRQATIREVTQLFPKGDHTGYLKREDQQILNLESQFPFWYEKKDPPENSASTEASR